jgi:hypothetical protein
MTDSHTGPPPADDRAQTDHVNDLLDACEAVLLVAVKLCVRRGFPAHVVIASLMRIATLLNAVVAQDDKHAEKSFEHLVSVARVQHEQNCRFAETEEAARFLETLRSPDPADLPPIATPDPSPERSH